MKSWCVLLLLVATPAVLTRAQTTPAPAEQGPLVDASAAIPRDGVPRFFTLHERFLKRGREGSIGVLFLGDSITERWQNAPHILSSARNA